MIYFDNSATTKPYKEVLDTFVKVSEDIFGNPSSLHSLGVEAERVLTKSRELVAHLLGVEAKEIFFTSGGTEGNNVAIRTVCETYRSRGRHIITSSVEHPSVYETFQALEKQGYNVTYVPVNRDGVVSVSDVIKSIRDDTILVSLIHVNNETGSIQPIEQIGEELKKFPKVIFHVDGVQGVTKVPLNIKKAGIDLYTISGHKFHGLKGTGVLYVRANLRLQPLFTGGGQESGFRAGTENVAGMAALAKALKMSLEKANKKLPELRKIRDYIFEQLEKMDGVVVNSPKNGAPHIINFSIPNTKPEVVIQALSQKKIYVSTKSACSSKLNEPSRVILAMGLGEERASSAIRVSLNFDNTLEEAKTFLTELKQVIIQLKEVMR